jgi:hypothetical protein
MSELLDQGRNVAGLLGPILLDAACSCVAACTASRFFFLSHVARMMAEAPLLPAEG